MAEIHLSIEQSELVSAHAECQQQISDTNLRMDKETVTRCERINYYYDTDLYFQKILNPPIVSKDEDDDPASLSVPVKEDDSFHFSNFFMDFATPSRPVKVENLPATIGTEDKVSMVLGCSKSNGGVEMGGAKEEEEAVNSLQEETQELKEILNESVKALKEAKGVLEALDKGASGIDLAKSDVEEAKSAANEVKSEWEESAAELKSAKEALKQAVGETSKGGGEKPTHTIFTPLTSPLCSPASNPISILQTTTTMPKYLYNDYMKRIPNSYELTKKSPSALLVEPGTSTPILEACPASLHAFYTVLGEESAVLDARVFSLKEIAVSLSPGLGFASDDTFFVKFSTSKSPFDIPASGKTGFKDASLKSTVDGMFVPSGHAVAFKNPSSDKAVSVLRHCFADASNFNTVKNSLRLQSQVSKESKRLLNALSIPSFDTKMERNAMHVPYERHLVWPRELEADKPQEGGAVEDTNRDTKAKKRRERKDRKKKKQSFGDWQAAKAWDHKVLGLTLPTLQAPSIVSTGRRNVTLAWDCPFEMREGDSATLSFAVSWDGMSGDGETELDGETIFLSSSQLLKAEVATDAKSQAYGITTKKYLATVTDLKPASRYHFKVALRYGEAEDDEDTSQSLFSSSSLLSVTEHEGVPFPISSSAAVVKPKDWDKEFHPRFLPVHGSDATMVLLKFLSPSDNGGHDIDGYDIARSHVDNENHDVNDWKVLSHGVEILKQEGGAGLSSSETIIAIHHLLPGANYRFKVAAKNILGRGEWSAPTAKVSTRLGGIVNEEVEDEGVDEGHGFVPAGGHMVHGFGSGIFTDATHEHDGSGVFAVVDDQGGSVELKNGRNIEVWSAHWSPKVFKVSGELVDVVEVEGERGKIENIGQVDHRIAVVKRDGKIPLVRKALAAQKAGAVAVVIVDDGRCGGVYDQYCVLGANKMLKEGWGEIDNKRVWKSLRIPTVLVDEGLWEGEEEEEVLVVEGGEEVEEGEEEVEEGREEVEEGGEEVEGKDEL